MKVQLPQATFVDKQWVLPSLFKLEMPNGKISTVWGDKLNDVLGELALTFNIVDIKISLADSFAAQDKLIFFDGKIYTHKTLDTDIHDLFFDDNGEYLNGRRIRDYDPNEFHHEAIGYIAYSRYYHIFWTSLKRDVSKTGMSLNTTQIPTPKFDCIVDN